MGFAIIEIQYSNGGSMAVVPPTTYSDRNDAEAKYHTVLAAAAKSNINVHSVTMLDETGSRVKGEVYYHGSSNNAE